MLAVWLAPEVMRFVIPIALLVCYVGYHAWRWRGTHQDTNVEKLAESAAANKAEKGAEEVKVEGQGAEAKVEGQEQNRQPWTLETQELEENAQQSSPAPGEAEYARARAMPHQEIPDFRVDGLYLDLLGESADKGYSRAMAKLGEYAMRRETWVEAYYWMWRAQRCGMANLESVLREIRQCWIAADCPDEEENAHDLFDEKRGSIGRALLGISAGCNAGTARAFLKKNHPEFL